MQSLNLKKFDPRIMEKRRVDPNKGPPTILIVGPRGTGKSYLIKALMYYFRRIPAGMMITESESSVETFSEFFPKSFIYDEVDIDKIETIVKNQKKLRKKNTPGDYSSLLLFDDCGYDKSIVRKKVIKKIFCNGRHLRVLLIMTVQYCKDIPPDLRCNADFVFILRESTQGSRRKLWTEYASIIPDFNTFNEVMNVCTDNRGVLVVDNTTISNDITDNIFWYRAPDPIKKFKVGSKSLWKFHEENYKSDSDESDNDESIAPVKPKVLVKKIKKPKVLTNK